MGVSKNKGTPKWIVYNGKAYENEWFWGTPILGNTHISSLISIVKAKMLWYTVDDEHLGPSFFGLWVQP